MSVRHTIAYSKDNLYSCAFVVSINHVGDDMYILQVGPNRRKIDLLHEKIKGVYTGRIVLHYGTNMYSFFENLYSSVINPLSDYKKLKKELFTFYISRDIYLHKSVFDFLEKVSIYKPEIFYDDAMNGEIRIY